VCDDGNTVSGDGCNATCTSDETCGNGIVDVAAGEMCDDGNLDDFDGCLSICETDVDLDGISDRADACDGLPAGSYLAGRLAIDNVAFQMPNVGSDLVVAPGTDGGLLLGSYQNSGLVGADNTAILDPTTFAFYGHPAAVGFYSNDPSGNRPGSFGPPTLLDLGAGRLRFDLSGWTAFWNGIFFNQGPTDTTLLGYDSVANTATGQTGSGALIVAEDGGQGGQTVGTYDVATGATHLEWNSRIAGGSFGGLVGRWVVDGVMVGCPLCDTDGDGVLDRDDRCQGFDDTIDTDGDGVPDGCDLCPTDPLDDLDGDCLCGNPADPEGLLGFDPDTDGDGLPNLTDPCPNDPDNDLDGDTVCGDVDNCTQVANLDQTDTDGDGYGNVCDGDFNNNGVVDFADYGYFRSVFSSADPLADFNGNGIVDFADYGRFRAMFGAPPGPSGVAP